MKKPFVSLIVACREIDAYTRECIEKCLNLNYKNFEILLLPDKEPNKRELQNIKSKKIRVMPTGKVKPGEKRNIAMKKAKGEIYAFIDSDAYPEKNWLKKAVKYFSDSSIGIVGGPNLTPPHDNFKQKISGMLLANWLCAGPRASIRYRIAKRQFTPELPTCNLLVRRDAAKKFNLKFRPELLTEEDSKFCFDMAKHGRKVLYVPDAIVYHHRREAFLPHLRQIWIYGRDVAFLFKREFSHILFYYTIPPLFVLGIIAGAILSFFSIFIRTIYLAALAFYLAITLMSSMKKDIKTTAMLFLGIIGTHFAYGLGFIYGLISKNRAGLNVR